MEAMIETKQSCIQNNSKREQEIQEIAERALQDKNFDEIQWRNIELTHTFVNKMLKHKIDKEMDKFHVVEFAFKEIKTATVILKIILGRQRCEELSLQISEQGASVWRFAGQNHSQRTKDSESERLN